MSLAREGGLNQGEGGNGPRAKWVIKGIKGKKGAFGGKDFV